MLTKNPTAPQASPAPAEPVTQAGGSVIPLDPHAPIETASTGNGTIGDPAAKDNKPPGFSGLTGLELLA